jgi:hypothetical protein
MTSPRVLAGSLTKGSKVINVGVDPFSNGTTTDSLNEFDAFRQGYNVPDDAVLTNHVSYKIRSNSGHTKTLEGRDLDETVFDDTYSTTAMPTTDPTVRLGSSMPTLSDAKKLSRRLNHIAEQRDLGQSLLYTVYDPGFFHELPNPDDAVLIINTDPMKLMLPWGLVDHSSNSSLDGIIEPLLARSSIDRSTPEFPFTSKGVRSTVGHAEDVYKQSVFIQPGYDVPDDSSQVYDLSAQYYLDATEFFEGVVELPAIFPVDERRILPFIDASNDRERYYARTDVDEEMANIIVEGSTFNDDNVVEWNIMGRTGWIRAGNGSVDSVVYAGLLRG